MRPIYDMLQESSGRRSFHMPGHKGRPPFGPVDVYALDTTELPVTDDLYCPERGIRRAEELYARAAGAAETIFLHNGSTAGIHVMVQLYAGEGDEVILPRNAHLSAVNGCVLGGVRAAWIPVTTLPDGYAYIAEEDALRTMEEHPHARAILLTRPDFYGGCIPLERIVEKAHAMDMRVVVDEAHGAHLPWLEGIASAGEMGADAWVQSVHKTLPGLTGSAVLHLKSAADAPRAMRILRREQTSSPSFPLLMSIDDARAYMEGEGRERLNRLAKAAGMLRGALGVAGYEDAHGQWRRTGYAFDPTRLVIHAPQGGAALAQSLRDRGVDVEMADVRRAVLILTCMDGPETLLPLLGLLREIPAYGRLLPMPHAQRALPERAMELRPAVLADCEAVPLERAAGRVAAASAGLYPPGIPLVCPGEVIGKETANLLMAAGHQERFGVEGDSLLCVKL